MAVDSLLITILNMSLMGTYVIVVVCLARLLLKKSPKAISYCLWTIAGIRLVLPLSIDSMLSLVPFSAQPIETDIIAPAIYNAVSFEVSPGLASNLIMISGFIWFTGAAVMFGYGIVSYISLKRKLKKSTHKHGNIFEGIHIKSPYVLGFLSPKIYLPLGLSDDERKYVILHEQIHIRRYDHFVKFIAYFILSLHWFNPLVWLAFKLMCRDMEMSCDEYVLKEIDVAQTREKYSMALVALAMEKRFVTAYPLAFGESSIKARVNNVLNFKKYSKLTSAAAIILAVVLSVGLMTNATGMSITENSHEESIWPIYPTFSCCDAYIHSWHSYAMSTVFTDYR